MPPPFVMCPDTPKLYQRHGGALAAPEASGKVGDDEEQRRAVINGASKLNATSEHVRDGASTAGQMISVVIPAYNEANRLPSSLAAAHAYLSSVFDRFELILVDDGSTDATASIASEFSTTHPHT